MHKFNAKNPLLTFRGFSFLKESEIVDESYVPGSYDLDEVNRKIRRAIVWISINKGFYAVPLSHLNIFASATIDPPTMCTDGESIIFHPDFVARHTDEAVRLVLIHEVLHCLNRHHERRGERDPRKWNVACDYAINPLLMDESGLEFPKDANGKFEGLYEEKYVGMRAEEIYDDLEMEIQEQELTMEQLKKLIEKAKECGLVDDEGELSDEEILDDGIIQAPDVEDEEGEEGEGQEGEDGEGDEKDGDCEGGVCKSGQQPGKKPGQQGQPGQPGQKPGQPGQKPGQPGQPGQKPGQPGQKPGQPGQPGQQPGQPGQPSQQQGQQPGQSGQSNVLPKVGETVLLDNGKEVVVRRVYPNGDIEI